MVKRIALKTAELAAAAVLVSLLYYLAEAPLRFAEYRMMNDRG
jgi:hypothetical protein